VFWTGDAVRGKVSRRAAETFQGIAKHRVILWDNYPVNDDYATMNLGPVTGLDAGLGEVLDGYICNPMCKQNEIDRIPLATCADYAYNPRAYDPLRSVGQAILLQAKKPAQREVLRDLVESYPGFFMNSASKNYPAFNPVRTQMEQILAMPQSRLAAQAYLDWLQQLAERLDRQFPHDYAPAKATLADDLNYVRQKLAASYP
jgi:hypothetical protein